MHIFNEEILLRLLLAMLAGLVLGVEREVQRKAAGIRTISLICVSSALFTIVGSHMPNGSGDRIASNILTGVGFIGAGVIFRGGFTVDGITTAATIWISSAIGIAIGIGAFFTAAATVGITLLVLWGLTYVEAFISNRRDRKYYAIRYLEEQLSTRQLEALFLEHELTVRKISTARCDPGMLEGKYELTGRVQQMDQVNDRLLALKAIERFEVELIK